MSKQFAVWAKRVLTFASTDSVRPAINQVAHKVAPLVWCSTDGLRLALIPVPDCLQSWDDQFKVGSSIRLGAILDQVRVGIDPLTVTNTITETYPQVSKVIPTDCVQSVGLTGILLAVDAELDRQEEAAKAKLDPKQARAYMQDGGKIPSKYVTLDKIPELHVWDCGSWAMQVNVFGFLDGDSQPITSRQWIGSAWESATLNTPPRFTACLKYLKQAANGNGATLAYNPGHERGTHPLLVRTDKEAHVIVTMRMKYERGEKALASPWNKPAV